MNDLATLWERMSQPSILVVGDVMLDRYTWGNAERVSPEAPVIVLQADQREVRLGGAASVALLLRALAAEVHLAGVVGDDAEGRIVRRLLEDAGIDQRLVLTDRDRPTTTKERFIGRAAGRHPHQILRVDQETCEPLPQPITRQLFEHIADRCGEFAALLISDYAKGVCSAPQPCATPTRSVSEPMTACDFAAPGDSAFSRSRFGLVSALIDAAKHQGIPVLIDPARVADYCRYAGCDVLIPNRAEAESIVGSKISSTADALAGAKRLQALCQAQSVIVKLDRDGMVLVDGEHCDKEFPTRVREVVDVTGAGDMVLAIVGLCRATRVPLSDAVRLANLGAGLEVERIGVAPVTRAEILAECLREQPAAHDKLLTLNEMEILAESYRHAGRRIVFTNGCFDLLHVGHVTCLQAAAQFGDVLVVAINSDASVRRLKGLSRPIIGERDRAQLLAALACVHHVLIFDDDTPHELLRRIRPDVLVKGGTTLHVVGAEIVENYGGRVVRTAEVPDVSTTRIASRLTQQQTLAISVPSPPHRGRGLG